MKGQVIRTIAWVVGVVVIAAAIVAIAAALSPDSGEASDLHSSPTAVRPWAAQEWDALMSPPAAPVDIDDYRVEFREHSLSDLGEDGRRTLSYRAAIADEPPVTDAVFAEIGATAENGARFDLKWIGTAPIAPSHFQDADSQKRVTLDIYSPDGTLVPENQHERFGVSRWARSHYVQPEESGMAIGLRIEPEGIDDPTWRFHGFFDNRTRVKLSSGGSWTSSGSYCEIKSQAAVLHDAVLRAVIDVFHAPYQSHSLAAAAGEELRTPTFTASILRILPGDPEQHGSSWSSSADERTGEFAFGIEEGSEAKSATFLVALSPEGVGRRLAAEAILKDGTEIPVSADIHHNIMIGYRAGAPADQIETLRFNYRAGATRLVVLTPPLPGVPAANRGVADLFDLEIPWLTAEHDYEFQNAVASLAQLDLHSSLGHSTPFLPATMENAALRSAVGQYLAATPELSAESNAASMTLHFFKPGPKSSIMKRFADWINLIR